MVRPAGMGLAVVTRVVQTLLIFAASLLAAGASPGEERQMLVAFERALTAMVYVAASVSVFAIVWAGFLLMAEGADERAGRARSAVVLAVVGLAVVLAARGIAALIRSGVIPVPPH